MSQLLPPVDDTAIWNDWMALYRVPAISVALELELFESLDAMPDSVEGLARRRGFDERGLRALLAMLCCMDYLRLQDGCFRLTEIARQYLLRGSPWCWDGVFRRLAGTILPHRLLLETINGEREHAEKTRPADGWESGEVEPALAREVTAFMHSHSAAAATGLARGGEFSGLRRLLDIGGGSGCFSLALAGQHPQLHCTVMDLASICELADGNIESAGMTERVDTRVVDMFRQQWPEGYDAHLFSNVFHDWSVETCQELARRSHAALADGGCILLHEMLLDDGGLGPLPAVAFSLLMAMGTKGQQFTLPELRAILEGAGFRDVRSRPSHGYYWLVSAKK